MVRLAAWFATSQAARLTMEMGTGSTERQDSGLADAAAARASADLGSDELALAPPKSRDRQYGRR